MLDQPRILALPMTAAYFRLIMRRFGDGRSSRDRLLAGTDYHDEPAAGAGGDAEIPVRSQVRQLVNLDRVAPPGWGLEFGATLDVATHGPSGLVAVTAPSLATALDAVIRYMTVRSPFVDLRPAHEPGRFALRIVEPCALGAIRTPLLEMVLLSLQATIETAMGRRMGEAAFTMPAPRPAYWRRYEEFFHAPVTFAGVEAGVSLPAEWLSLPCPLADPIAHRSTWTRLESIRRGLAGDFVDVRVERIFAASNDAGPSLGDVAAQLGLSVRTLDRRLAERNTSFRHLLDRHRRERATELLAQHHLTVAEIAERLGYGEATNFTRACRRWFGTPPTSYRRRLRLGRAPS
jgi:AraC-like DNA-binding protein